jgi:hypothetical protein
MNENFILGIIAGEGSFYVALYLKESGVVRPAPSFSVKMNDTHLLKQMRAGLGVGGIVTRGGQGTTWQVQADSECRTVREFIEDNCGELFQLTNKYEQYLLWSEALDIVEGQTNTRLSAEDKKRLVDISFGIAESDNGRTVTKKSWYRRVENE